jgi:hypothetical protein
MDPEVPEASRRFHPEPLAVPLGSSTASPVPASRTEVTQRRTPTWRHEDKPAVATPSAFKYGLGGIVQDDHA